MVQARKADTTEKETIGNFEESPNTSLISSCSSIMSTDRDEKKEVTLVWKAPSDTSGKVVFV